MHGLLQTTDYARALVMSIDPGVLGPTEVEHIVALRMARQQVLAKDPPPQLHFILDETILHRLIGYTECPAGTLYIENRDQVRYWVLRFGILTQWALPRQESAELIAQAMHNFE